MKYDRTKAVNYAKKWALGRNPNYYNYDNIGGDCTNFISQCLYAGKPEMNYDIYGWYYYDANNKSPSWTGVEFLYNFLVSNNLRGPRGKVISRGDLELGDVIQLSFDGFSYGHSLIVTKINNGKIFVCAHTFDALDRELITYDYKKIRYIKIS